MKILKSLIYRIIEKLGLRSQYLILLFKIRKGFQIQTDEERRLMRFYSEIFISRPRMIIDIGANVGIRTGVFSKISKEVIALEPNQELASVLRSKFKDSNVKVLEKACAADSSFKEFFLGDNHLVSTLSTRFIDHKKESGATNSWNQKIEVETISLDQLIDIYGVPDFCKIDVEGYEKEVLSGLNKKIGLIAFEFNYPSFEMETLFCLEKLNELGYSRFNFSIGESLKMNFDCWVSFEEIIDFFMLKNFPFGICYGDIYAR